MTYQIPSAVAAGTASYLNFSLKLELQMDLYVHDHVPIKDMGMNPLVGRRTVFRILPGHNARS
eukprot:4085752-Amphidinium_carterae.1